ncbi:hypothetical protein HK098_003929 [Nowakowskiella sp. JEL0407]|nr:hypothetical protein HK098_003929 [Nowakowskiella sp. JEL0407]
MHHWNRNSKVLGDKEAEYRLIVSQYEKQLSSTDVLTPESLLSTQNHVQKQLEELEELEHLLKSYKDLPPDITLAQVKLEEMKEQLVRINVHKTF